jgi:HK97 family phage portal protein
MIIRTRGGHDMEVRAAPDPFWPALPPPGYNGMRATTQGTMVSVEMATGLPVVFQCIRLLGELIACLPVRVYRGTMSSKKEQPKTWQWGLLCDTPNDEQSAFDFWYDVAASVESHGNAFILKVKMTVGRVDAIYLLDPTKVVVWRDKGEKVFRIWNGSQHIDLTASEVLHVRGPTIRGGDMGMSPIAICRDTIGSALDRTSYEGHFYRHNASPGGALKFPERMDRQKARDVVRVWAETHGGPSNAGLPAVLTGGADWVDIGVPLREAQFIEANDFTVADVGRMFNIPAQILNHGATRPSAEEDARRLLNFTMLPRLRRITEALRSDTDLFGSGEIYPRHFTDEFIQADAKSMAEVRHFYVQDGVLLVDEVRAELGYPPLPDGAGKVPQITPVGGAPNASNPPPADPGSQDPQAASFLDGDLERRQRLARARFGRAFNPNQPRDDHGRWGDGSSIADTLGHIDKMGLNEWPMKGKSAKKILGNAADTQALHTVNGRYTQERKTQVHDKIVAKSMVKPCAELLGEDHSIVKKLKRGQLPDDADREEIRKANIRKRKGAQPRALFLAGGPASGKTSALKQDPSVVPPAAVQINPDDVKEQLPEYQTLVGVRDRYAAMAAHEESSTISKRIQAEALDLNMNLVVDGTGDSKPGKFTGKMKESNEAGYEVSSVYVTVQTDTAVIRATKRAFKSGRWVPVGEVRNQHKNVSANFPDVAALPFLADLKVYDNGADKPVLIAQGSGGTVQPSNDALYATFLMKSEETISRTLDDDRELRAPSNDIPVNEWIVEPVADSADYLDVQLPVYEDEEGTA